MVIHEGSWAQDDKNKIILGTTSSQQQTIDGVIQIVYLLGFLASDQKQEFPG